MRHERALSREYLEALLIAVIFATFARTFVVQAFKIPTASMERNLLVGDHILVNKFIYGSTVSPLERWLLPQRRIRRGDVVVFKFPGDPTRDFIKRCVGLPGDEVLIQDKELSLNGQAVDDSAYTYHSDPRVFPSSRFLREHNRYRDNFGPIIVDRHRYFCLGDNRDNSNDSRAWGQVPEGHVKGRALMIYWSFEPLTEPESGSVAAPGGGSRWRELFGVLTRFFTETRWERTFRIVR
jgi:signal peptidase I